LHQTKPLGRIHGESDDVWGTVAEARRLEIAPDLFHCEITLGDSEEFCERDEESVMDLEMTGKQ
jgi:hypothetical protein